MVGASVSFNANITSGCVCRAYDEKNFHYVHKKDALKLVSKGELLVATTYAGPGPGNILVRLLLRSRASFALPSLSFFRMHSTSEHTRRRRFIIPYPPGFPILVPGQVCTTAAGRPIASNKCLRETPS
jgi:hypothetical protein